MMLDPAGWEALRLSLLVGVTATVLALPFAIWVAWLLARREFWGKSALNAAVQLPLVLPPVVTGYRLMVRALRLAIEAVDPKLEQAARTRGAPGWAGFRTVTLPLILPGILAGGVMGFAKAIGEFGATITFVANIPGETQTLPSAIYALLQVPGGEDAAIRLVLWACVLALGAVVLSEWLARRVAARIAGT